MVFDCLHHQFKGGQSVMCLVIQTRVYFLCGVCFEDILEDVFVYGIAKILLLRG